MSQTPPALDETGLKQALGRPAGRFRRVDVVAEVGSSNIELAAAAAAQPADWPDLSVLIADSQVAGKGRLDRVWEAPAGAAMISSVLLRPAELADGLGAPPFDPVGHGWLSILAGVALCQGVAAETGVRAELKWPNDVLVNGRKVAGILAQLVAVPGAGGTGASRSWRGPAVVVGAGVNVSQERPQLPVDTATSLLLEDGTQLDRNVLLPAYLNRFAQLYRGFVGVGGDAMRPIDGGESLHALASGLMGTLGAPVRAELPGGRMLLGTAVGLTAGGALEVRDDSAAVHVVSAGDVVHLRRRGEGGTTYA